jgi:hypothetical protein
MIQFNNPFQVHPHVVLQLNILHKIQTYLFLQKTIRLHYDEFI